MPPKTHQRPRRSGCCQVESDRSSLRHVAILGLGLMGTSLGMALRATDRKITGYDQAPGVADRALARGAIDVAARRRYRSDDYCSQLYRLASGTDAGRWRISRHHTSRLVKLASGSGYLPV